MLDYIQEQIERRIKISFPIVSEKQELKFESRTQRIRITSKKSQSGRLTSRRHQLREADRQSYWTDREPHCDSTTTSYSGSNRRSAGAQGRRRRRRREAKAEASKARPPSVSYWRGQFRGGSRPQDRNLNRSWNRRDSDDNSSIIWLTGESPVGASEGRDHGGVAWRVNKSKSREI